MQTHGMEITDEQYKENCDIESFIRNKTGIIINQCEYNHDGTPLFEYACTHPDCNKGFKTFNEYVEHRKTAHCDELSVLNFYLADLIRWIRKTESIPAVKDFFKELFIGHIVIRRNEELEEHYSYFDEDKYLSSVERIGRLEVDSSWKCFTSRRRTLIAADSPLAHMIEEEFEIQNFIDTMDEDIETDFPISGPIDTLIGDPEETSIETDVPGENESVEPVTLENIGSFIEYIISSLKSTKEPDELIEIIHSLTRAPICDEIIQRIEEHDQELPALFTIAFKHKWLPAPRISSPFIGENKTFNNLSQSQNYIRSKIGSWTNNEAIGNETVYYFPITGEGRWRIKYNETNEIAWNQNPRFCQYFDCDYGLISPKFSSHAIIGRYKNDCSKYDKFGPFWGPHIKQAVEQDSLIKTGYFLREREFFKCHYQECPSCFGRLEDLRNHYLSKAHKDKNRRDGVPCKLVWCTKEEEIEHWRTIRQQENRESARPLQEQSNAQAQPAGQPAETNPSADQHQTEPVQNANEQSTQVQRDTTIPPLDDETAEVIFNEPSNDHLIAQARDWITHYSNIENSSIGIPTLTPARRKQVKQGLTALYDHTIIPLLRKFMPLNDSEDERLKLDGVIYKIADEFREHCRRNLNLTKEKMYRNPTSSQSINNENRRRITEKAKDGARAMTAASISRDSSVCLSALIEIREIMKRDAIDLAGTNRINKLKKEIRNIVNLREDDWCNNLFGGRDDNCVDSTINLQDDQFERRCEWLRARIDETASQANHMKEKIREMFGDNPKKCLNRYVWPKTTPECSLTPEQFSNHYGKDWSSTTEQYQNPTLIDDRNIDVTICEGVEQRFKEYMENEKKIEDVIMSRNYISAHGKDGLSNARYRLNVTKATEMFSIIFKAIVTTKHVPTSWKNTKTIMLYKKGDPSIPKNWRPIGITSTMYRVFAAYISGFILNENKIKSVFHPAQKGFIGGGNGAMDHISTLNELVYHAKRTNENIILTVIDLTNAFGSVPHDLIFDAISRKG